MSQLLRPGRQVPDAPAVGRGSSGRPVLLATLAVPFEPESARVAIQAAMEGDLKLVVVDVVEMPFLPQCWVTRRADIELDLGYQAVEEKQPSGRVVSVTLRDPFRDLLAVMNGELVSEEVAG